jgi:KUP system potassium uptake protein
VHERTILLTLITEVVPYVHHDERVTVKPLDQGFCRVIARYGFMEMPDVPALLEKVRFPNATIESIRSATSSAASS